LASNATKWIRFWNNYSWSSWHKFLSSFNYTDYTVTKSGSGATGTWDISISGNATTATTASRVSGAAGTANVARHVWFSEGGTETVRNYDDDFMYNPSTNTLTVANLAGNATTATTATHSNYPMFVANNEIRFSINSKPSSAISLCVGYKWSDGTSDAKISRYIFYNGAGAVAEV